MQEIIPPQGSFLEGLCEVMELFQQHTTLHTISSRPNSRSGFAQA